MAIGILTKEGISDFYSSHEMNSKKQFYLYWDSHLKIGLVRARSQDVTDIKGLEGEKRLLDWE